MVFACLGWLRRVWCFGCMALGGWVLLGWAQPPVAGAAGTLGSMLDACVTLNTAL